VRLRQRGATHSRDGTSRERNLPAACQLGTLARFHQTAVRRLRQRRRRHAERSSNDAATQCRRPGVKTKAQRSLRPHMPTRSGSIPPVAGSMSTTARRTDAAVVKFDTTDRAFEARLGYSAVVYRAESSMRSAEPRCAAKNLKGLPESEASHNPNSARWVSVRNSTPARSR